MDIMNRPAEVFLHGLQCTEDAVCIGRVNTSLALNVLNWTIFVFIYTAYQQVRARS